MIICEKCFISKEIKSIIKSNETIGNCGINANHKDCYICDLQKNDKVSSYIANSIIQITDLYSIKADLPVSFDKGHLSMLKDSLFSNWPIFSMMPNKIHELLGELFHENDNFDMELLQEPVGIIGSQEDKILIDHSSWKDFSESLRYKNRFHCKINNTVFKELLRYTEYIIPKDREFYRCRISNNKKLTKYSDLDRPPAELANPGRFNSKGVSRLYLGSNWSVCIKEIRASVFDNVYIGKFITESDLRVLDFRNLVDKTFSFFGNPLRYYLNRNVLIEISSEINNPTPMENGWLNYIPSQYLADLVQFLGYEGILYESAIESGVDNLMLFDSNKVKCTEIHLANIQNINYAFKYE